MKKLTAAEQVTLSKLVSRAKANSQCAEILEPQTAPETPDAIKAVLNERGARYGDFSNHARLAQRLIRSLTLFSYPIDNGPEYPPSIMVPWDNMPAVNRQALTVICDKLARIMSGDCNYADNWVDIQGYARLVEERLPKN
jgi:hypothetical protein